MQTPNVVSQNKPVQGLLKANAYKSPFSLNYTPPTSVGALLGSPNIAPTTQNTNNAQITQGVIKAPITNTPSPSISPQPTTQTSTQTSSNAPGAGLQVGMTADINGQTQKWNGTNWEAIKPQNINQNQVPQQTGPQSYQPNAGFYGQAATDLANRFSQPNEAFTAQQQAMNKTLEEQKQLEQNLAKGTANIGGSRTNLSEAQGEQGILERLGAQKSSALASQYAGQASQLGALNTQQQLQQGALGTAAGLAAPQLGAAGQVPFNPLTGTQGNILGGQGGGFDINALSDQVVNGQMTIDQANSALGGNIALTGALRQAIAKKNPNFNFSISSASGQTQATGQQIQTSQKATSQALDSLQTAYDNLNSLQATGVPIWNQIAQGISMATGVGREQASAFQGALNEARAQINAVLSPMIGVEAAGAQANTLLPDNMIPKEIPQKIEAAKTYIQQRVDAFTKSGQQEIGTGSQANTNQGTNPYSYNNFWQ